MRHRIEFGKIVRIPFWNVGFALGLALSLLVVDASGESTSLHDVRQSGSLSAGDSHAANPRAIPAHAPGYLGIQFADLSAEQASLLRLKGGGGVEVINVDHDGPAGKAGLRPHDVIFKMNGVGVVNAETLRRMIHDAGVGAGISLLVEREGKQVTVNAQLAYRGEVEREAMARMVVPAEDGAVVAGFSETYEVEPEPPASAGKGPGFIAQMLHSTPFTGLVVEAIEPQLAGFFGSSTGGGLLVETVVAGSPAAAAGLRAGDVVERADSIAVKSASEWARRLHASKGQAMTLVVLRDRREISITLIPQLKKHAKVEWPTLYGDLTLVA